MKAANAIAFLLATMLLAPIASSAQRSHGGKTYPPASHSRSENAPSVFTTDPIAGVGHGALLSPDGDEVDPSPEFVLEAQHFYRDSLLPQATEQQRADFNALQNRLFDLQVLNQHEKILVNSALVAWLIEAVNPSDAIDLATKNTALRHRIEPITLSAQDVVDVGDAPISKAIIDLLSREGLLRLAAIVQQMPSEEILKARDAYEEECRAAGVPIPPDFGTTGWVRQPDPLPFSFISNVSKSPAEVFVYESRTPRGVCIALPRSSGITAQFPLGTKIELLGVICQGNDTPSRACFWDNQFGGVSQPIPKTPPGNPKTETTFVPRRDFAAGAELFLGSKTGPGTCTDCHAGENAFIVHPKASMPMLPAPLDLGDQILRPNTWYKPLVHPSWPQNPGPTDVLVGNTLCLSCHGQTTGRQFPAVSTELDSYCKTILPQAFGRTMPPGSPGNSAYRGQFDALIAACKRPPAPFLIGELVNVSGQITFLRVNEVGDLFGAPGDDISGEVIIKLDSIPDLFFGLQLRRDQNRLTHRAEFRNLKTAFENNIPVAIDYRRKSAHIGTIERVFLSK